MNCLFERDYYVINTYRHAPRVLSKFPKPKIEQLFRSPLLFGPDADFDAITPELFELKVSGISLGRPVDATTFKSMSPQEKFDLKDDSKPRDYLSLSQDPAKAKGNRLGPFPRDAKTGRVNDDLLADALLKATSVPAAAFKARGVPHVMRVIEILVRLSSFLFLLEPSTPKPSIY